MYTFQDYEDDVANDEDRPMPVAHVRHEIEQHGAAWEEFVSEFGERDSYSARSVLGWLGY